MRIPPFQAGQMLQFLQRSSRPNRKLANLFLVTPSVILDFDRTYKGFHVCVPGLYVGKTDEWVLILPFGDSWGRIAVVGADDYGEVGFL